MRQPKINLLFLAISMIFLNGCGTYGYRTKVEYTKLKKVDCDEKPTNIHLFFNVENIDFDYEKIGIVEVKGKENESTENIINHLKYKAWSNCANGIININKNVSTRKRGDNLMDLIDFSEDRARNLDIYDAKFYTGVAVRIKKDTAFLAKYGNDIDTTFVEKVKLKK